MTALISRIWGCVDTNPANPGLAELSGHWRRRVKGDVHQTSRVGSTNATSLATSPDGRLEVAVDGMFFEHPDSSSAEVFLHAYLKNAFAGALEKLDGDFAVGLVDRQTNEVWLGRDPFGVRPLYFAEGSGKFSFSSQPAALASLPWVGREPSDRFVALFAASHYRTFDNRPWESPYARVAQLPAGHWLRWKDGQRTQGRYWELKDSGDSSLPDKEMADRYRELLFEAVRKRLRCAPRRAFMLSGGMDSSSVLSAAVSLEGSKQVAASTVYDDATYDESEDIRTILDETVSNWIRVDVSKPDVHDLIGKMVQINDEPIATATWLSHFQLCDELGASGFPAVFTGLGGDELNAGEYEHFFFFFADLQAAGKNTLLEEEIRGWVLHHDHPIFKKNAKVAALMVSRVADLDTAGRCLPDRERIGKYSSVLAPGFSDLESFDPEMDRVFPSYLKNRTYQDIFRETAPCCLRAQDRHGFAFGLAHLNPFYDRQLVEFLFQVPGTSKIRSGVTKHLLREAMRGVLPEQTRTRIKKTGWNAPAHVWFSGSEADRLLDELKAGKLGKQGKLNLVEIERLVREHRDIVSSGQLRENHMMLLWQLANLNAWVGK